MGRQSSPPSWRWGLSPPGRRRGFSSVKLLPGTQMLVALKTEEVRGRFASYLTVLTLNGSVLMEDTHVKDVKYEGLEVAV